MARHMKHSGVDWLGDIPDDWNIVQLKRLAKIQTGNTPSKTENDKYYSQESGYLWIKPEDLGNITPITSTTEYLTEDGIKYGRLLPPNTVYVCCIASVGKVGFCNSPASCNQQINGLIFHNVHWKYGFYVTIAQESEYINNASGNVMKIINSDKQSRLMCPLPPIDEQERIAAYLDDKCGRIDSVISKTRATVDEYKKLKQAIITRAVTRGIRANRTLKHSGIEWLGDIPDDWQVLSLSAVTETMCNGYVGPTKDLFVDDGIKYIQSLHIKDGRIDFSRREYYVSKEWANTHPKIKENDVLIVQTGDIGNVGLVTSEYDDCNCHALIIATPRKNLVFPNYLTYYFRSVVGRELLLFYKTGALLPHLNSGKIKFASVCVPSIDEQREIAAYLDAKTSAIDSLVAKKNQLVAELERLKKSLIFEYVTGKKEVAQ